MSRARTHSADSGYACPRCKVGGTMVKDSRPRADGTVRRRRNCPACGHVFTTMEVPLEDSGSLAMLKDRAKRSLLQAAIDFRALARVIDHRSHHATALHLVGQTNRLPPKRGSGA